MTLFHVPMAAADDSNNLKEDGRDLGDDGEICAASYLTANWASVATCSNARDEMREGILL